MKKRLLFVGILSLTIGIGLIGQETQAFKLKDLKKKIGLDTQQPAPTPAGNPAGGSAAPTPMEPNGGQQNNFKSCSAVPDRDAKYSKEITQKILFPASKKAAQPNNCSKAISILEKELGVDMKPLKDRHDYKESFATETICSCDGNSYTPKVKCDNSERKEFKSISGGWGFGYSNTKVEVTYWAQRGGCYGAPNEKWIIDPSKY